MTPDKTPIAAVQPPAAINQAAAGKKSIRLRREER